jgi:hypothetical protein
MVDIYYIDLRKSDGITQHYNQEDLRKLSDNYFTNYIPYAERKIYTVTRYKGSTLPRDLNKALSKGDGRIIIICNPGCTLDDQFYPKILRDFETDNKIGAMGCQIMSREFKTISTGMDLKLDNPFCRGYLHYGSHPNTQHPTQAVYLEGKFIIIRREAWLDVNFFNEKSGYFWAQKFTVDAAMAGYKTWYNPYEIKYFNYYEEDLDKLEEKNRSSFEWFKEDVRKIREHKSREEEKSAAKK